DGEEAEHIVRLLGHLEDWLLGASDDSCESLARFFGYRCGGAAMVARSLIDELADCQAHVRYRIDAPMSRQGAIEAATAWTRADDRDAPEHEG
ncbi:MAG: hypothetical protein ACRD0A_03705, partial [Acidimicrobiales bacterium]